VGGKSVHATSYHKGVDALAIAVKMYEGIQSIFANEVDPKEKVVCRVTKLHSGTAQNIIPDYALIQGTIRTFNVPLSGFIHDRMQKLAHSLSELYGVEVKVHAPLKSTCVYNNPYLSELMVKSMEKVLGKENVVDVAFSMGSEDFSRYTDIVPSVFFRLGTRNEEKGITQVAHQVDFKVDEDAFIYGAQNFVQFVLDNQNGVDIEKAKESDERKLYK
jgi:amidohydrolase